MISIDVMTLYENICKRAKGSGINFLSEIEDNNAQSTLEEGFGSDSIEMSEEREPTFRPQEPSSAEDNICCSTSPHYNDRCLLDLSEEYMPFEEMEEREEKVVEDLDITLFSAYTILLWFVLDANLCRSSIEKLLKVIRMFLPLQNKLEKSKHLLFKTLNMQLNMEKYYICRECSLITKKNICNIHQRLDEFIMWTNPIDTFKVKLHRDARFFKLCQYYREY